MQRLSLLFLALLFGCGQASAPKADALATQQKDAQQKDAPPAAATPASAPVTGQFDTSHAGAPAPTLALERGPDGKSETIADILRAHPGKPVLVNLWATWCAPCIKELKTLDALAGSTDKLVVAPISQDMEGWRAVTPAWKKLGLAHLSTHVESKMQFGFELKATGLPLSILYGPDGKEIWRYAGDRDWNDMESRKRLGV